MTARLANFGLLYANGRMRGMSGERLGRTVTKPATRKTITIVHPVLEYGGAESVCVWSIAALCHDYDVELLTFSSADMARLNAHFGTSLRKTDFRVASPWGLRNSSLTRRMSRLAFHVAMRYCKLYRCHSLCFSTVGEMDFGVRGLQYVNFPRSLDAYKLAGILEFGQNQRAAKRLAKRAYYRACDLVSGFDQEAMKKNVTLVNSKWAGQIVSEYYGIPTQIVYPPVVGSFPDIPWAERENGFVCIGRVSPEKRIERGIRILSAMREIGFELHLHIIGPSGDRAYVRRLKRMPESSGRWVSFDGVLPREKLEKLIALHKYGIHTMPAEHFGIAIAEMVKAGCIPFVPANGGQVEIVRGKPELLFRTEDEAVSKIRQILASKSLQTKIRNDLTLDKDRFSVERFQDKIREIVAKIVWERNYAGKEHAQDVRRS